MAEPFHGIGGRPSASELARRAVTEIEAVAEAVLPDCRLEAGELRGHGNDGALWVIETRGAKRGVALCASEPERSGDPLTLIAEALYGGGRREAYGWLLARYGDAAAAPVARPREAPISEKDGAALERKRRRAVGRYLHAEPIAGTPADAYLAGRGIPPELYRRGGLRYAPASFYAAGIELPAMLAPVLDLISRSLIAVHCTYLEPREGGWTKTSRIPARKCWAPFRGGAIPLGRGASGKRLRDAPEDDGCLIAEGIENALSAAFLRPELRVFAAVSSGNIPAVNLPPAMASVVLVQDRDGENRAVADAYARAIDRWLHEGRGVEPTMRPPAGHADLNAWLQAELQKTGEAA